MRASIVVIAVLAPAAPAAAEPPAALRPQVQADLGLAVIGLGYELPVAKQLAIQLEGQIFGTYFLPWFDAGDDGKGVGGEVRATWFARPSGRGLYVLAYGRLDTVWIDCDEATARGIAVSGGAAAGWAFGLTPRLDLRVGLGLQYIYMHGEVNGTSVGASTPFPTIDGVLGYRL